MPAIINATVPKSPIKTPKTCRFVIIAPKRAMPTSVVKSGTIELKIEVIPLSSCVCANANKNGGKKELVSPATINHFQSFNLIVDKLRKPKRNKVKEANTIRKPPNCMALNPKSAFLINMKEEPQIKESSTK